MIIYLWLLMIKDINVRDSYTIQSLWVIHIPMCPDIYWVCKIYLQARVLNSDVALVTVIVLAVVVNHAIIVRVAHEDAINQHVIAVE